MFIKHFYQLHFFIKIKKDAKHNFMIGRECWCSHIVVIRCADKTREHLGVAIFSSRRRIGCSGLVEVVGAGKYLFQSTGFVDFLMKICFSWPLHAVQMFWGKLSKRHDVTIRLPPHSGHLIQSLSVVSLNAVILQKFDTIVSKLNNGCSIGIYCYK